MIVFENDGEIDPRMAVLMGVNAKEGESPIGFFGTGLKYAIACLARWGEEMVIQSGEAEFRFTTKEEKIRGKTFGLIQMIGERDSIPLAFTTELGKRWEPWMVYRELWSNCRDEPSPEIFEGERPCPKAGKTRVLVAGVRIEEAHRQRDEFLLGAEGRGLLAQTSGLEIHLGPGRQIFYRGIAVQTLDKPSIFIYNILEQMYLTEDRTAGQWLTDSRIASGLSKLTDEKIIDATLTATSEQMESRLDYCWVPKEETTWRVRAELLSRVSPMEVPRSVRELFAVGEEKKICPTCGQVMPQAPG